MKALNKPLFIIDSSQAHGRGEEMQWVSCTSGSCPFIANVVVIDQHEYARHYDAGDNLTAYSEPQSGIRLRVHVTNIQPGYDPSQVRTLLRKLVKELIARHQVVKCRADSPSDEAVLKFVEVLQGQNRENLRADPTNPTHRMVFGLLKKIHDEYQR